MGWLHTYVFLSFPKVILLLFAIISYILFFVFFKEQHCDKNKDRPRRTFWVPCLLFKDRGRAEEKIINFLFFLTNVQKFATVSWGVVLMGTIMFLQKNPVKITSLFVLQYSGDNNNIFNPYFHPKQAIPNNNYYLFSTSKHMNALNNYFLWAGYFCSDLWHQANT